MSMLRKMCLEEYDEDFVKMYDMVNEGVPIGDLIETIIFIEMVERVKKEWYKNGHFRWFKYLCMKFENFMSGIFDHHDC